MSINNIIDPAFDFISKIENVKKQVYAAYWDNSRYSIGFGTISFQGEQISYEEAKSRCKTAITEIYNSLEKYQWFNKLSSSRKIAVISYCYQYGVSGFLRRPTGIAVSTEKDPYYLWSTENQYSSRRKKEAELWKMEPVVIFGEKGAVIWIGLAAIIYFITK
jgi:GH24 family phage-related lysozyme (muramidase)